MRRSPFSRRKIGRTLVRLALPLVFAAFVSSSSSAGTNGVLTVAWDADTVDLDLSGYRVFLTTDPAVYAQPPSAAAALASTQVVGSNVTVSTFNGLDTTRLYYIAVTSLDYSGNESVFSGVVSAQPSTVPVLTAVSPVSAAQGATGLDVTLTGSDFLPQAVVSFGPGIAVTSLDTSGAPGALVARIDVDPYAMVDMRDVVVTNPGNASSTKRSAFEVMLDLAHVDINLSNRIDGGDMIAMAAGFAARPGEPGYAVALDLNVDGSVDAIDLSLLIQYFGRVGPF
jgi:hypothetical protein